MSNKRFISLPKGYLSYTQMQLWRTDPKRYAQLYFDGRADLSWSNRGQGYGKIVADMLEKGLETGDLLTDAAMLLFEKYDVADQRIDVDVKTPYGWLSLQAKPDSLDSATKAIIEYKTGKGHNPWDQRKAQNHLQMWFYAVVVWQKFGVMLPGAKLIWMETEDVPPYEVIIEGKKEILTIAPTGRIETFDVHFSKAGLMDALARIIKAAHEIEVAWASHVTKEWITTF